jgi:N-carbamoyl-D-amino-acid hydrolase
MTRHLTLAVCQLGPVPRSAIRSDTVGRLVQLLEQAAVQGAQLAVFPELALTTFFPRWSIDDPREIEAFFETEMPGAETKALYQTAKRLRMGFAIGYAERAAEGRRFNTMSLVGADGQTLGRYRKMHIPGSVLAQQGVTAHLERRYFEPGDLGFPVFDFGGVRVGLAICNDRRWPETYRMLCLNGAQLVLIGYNTPSVLEEAPELAHLRMFHNHLPMQAGAYQNTLWIAAAAKAGLEDGQSLIGGSCIIAPTGELAALALTLGDEVIVHRIDLGLIDICRRVNFDFALYRRPDQYGLITARAGPP